jgi:choline dehydrogenase-like flavoprotein
LLLLSGVGPTAEIEKHGIKPVHNLPSVGKNLRDHLHTLGPIAKRKPGSTARAKHYGDQKAVDAALEQWQKDGTGPLAIYACLLPLAYLRAEKVYESEEFKALNDDLKRYLLQETVPSYEVITVCHRHSYTKHGTFRTTTENKSRAAFSRMYP